MQARKKILVTRATRQSEFLCRLIEQQGWQAVRFPVIDIQAKALSAQEHLCVQSVGRFEYVFFISVNAVNFALQLFDGKIECLQKLSCVAVGKATFKALSACGVNSILVPVEGFNSEAILAMPELQALTGKPCLIVRGEGGRELLASTLRERGASVDYLEVYKRVLPVYDSRLVESYIQQKSLVAIVVYSGQALQNLVQMLAKENIKKNLLTILLVVISQRVHALAKKIGFKNIIIADEASDVAMVNALMNGEECG